jgi:hypothetical protein
LLRVARPPPPPAAEADKAKSAVAEPALVHEAAHE